MDQDNVLSSAVPRVYSISGWACRYTRSSPQLVPKENESIARFLDGDDSDTREDQTDP
jgi:hypothetical protein